MRIGRNILSIEDHQSNLLEQIGDIGMIGDELSNVAAKVRSMAHEVPPDLDVRGHEGLLALHRTTPWFLCVELLESDLRTCRS